MTRVKNNRDICANVLLQAHTVYSPKQVVVQNVTDNDTSALLQNVTGSDTSALLNASESIATEMEIVRTIEYR